MDPVTKNLRALQGALEHSLTIQRARVQEIIDELVSRGALSRTDADGLLGQLVASSKDYSQALLQVLATVGKTAGKTAGRIADTVLQAPRLVAKSPTETVQSSPQSAPPSARQQALEAETAPIPGYGDLTVAQIKPKLGSLDLAALQRIKDIELAGKNRKSVLAQIEQRLKSS